MGEVRLFWAKEHLHQVIRLHPVLQGQTPGCSERPLDQALTISQVLLSSGLRAHRNPSRSYSLGRGSRGGTQRGTKNQDHSPYCPHCPPPGAPFPRQEEGPGTTVTQCRSEESLWTPKPSASLTSKHRQWDWGRWKQNKGPARNRSQQRQLLSPARCVERPK